MPLKLSLAIAAIFILTLLELVRPKRPLTQQKTKRWITNFSLSTINTIALHTLYPLTLIQTAQWLTHHHIGLLNTPWLFTSSLQWLQTTFTISLITSHTILISITTLLCILILDLTLYAQHVASHHIPWFWKLHRCHHSDPDIDLSTGIRFHPLEILLSHIIKLIPIALLGISASTVLTFELLLILFPLFNHANLRLPKPLEKLLQLLIVTPEIHHIHHSQNPTFTNSNYGFFLSIWDKLCRTYTKPTSTITHNLKIGLASHPTLQSTLLKESLVDPFRKRD